MANIKSQLKDIKQNRKRNERNTAIRSELRTRTKTVLSSEGSEGQDAESLRLAIKSIDKAVSKGVIHKNTAARKKSLLMRKAAPSKTEAAPAGDAIEEAPE